MSTAGVKSTNISYRPAVADSVLVNRNGSTGLQTVDDLATQLAGSGPLAATGNYVIAANWPALAAIPGVRSGQPGRVPTSAAGTHTDPVVGGTVKNSGEYAWSVSPAGWLRVSDVIDASALQSDIDVVDERTVTIEQGAGGKLLLINAAGYVKGDLSHAATIARHVEIGPGSHVLAINAGGYVLADLSGQSPVTEETSIVPIFSDELFMVAGQSMNLYVPNLFPSRTDSDPAVVTVASVPSPMTAFTPFCVSSRETIRLDADRLSSTLELQARGNNDFDRVRRTVNVRKKTLSGAPAPKILTIGDSISNRECAAQVKMWLEAWGMTPTFIGTINGMGLGATDVLDVTGPLGECREGWAAYGDFLYAIPDVDVAGVLASGGEATYLAMTKDNKRKQNVFLRPATGGDAEAIVYNGYVFDFSYYLTRFSLATPDIVNINLWVNDVTEQGGAGVPQTAIGLNRIFDSIRAKSSAIQINAWFSTIPRALDSDQAWKDSYGAATRKIVETVLARRATDPNIHLIPAGCFQSREVGWAMNAGTTDAASGMVTTNVADYRHPTGIARAQQFHALAQACAYQA